MSVGVSRLWCPAQMQQVSGGRLPHRDLISTVRLGGCVS